MGSTDTTWIEGYGMWATRAIQLTPAAAAAEFAARTFDPPREVDLCWGAWTRGTYHGGFTLKDGVRTYRLFGDAGGLWAVTPGAEGPKVEGG